MHIEAALAAFSSKSKPDYRNTVKEAISAVEAIAQRVTGKPKATLGDAIDVLDKKQTLHPALRGAFDKLYGYANDSGGIRHALTEGGREPTFDEAKFMLVACAAFVNYVIGELKVAP